MTVEPNQVYRHYKGTHYRVLQIATEVAEQGDSVKKLVIYQDMSAPEKIWARPMAIFTESFEKNGAAVKRFALTE